MTIAEFLTSWVAIATSGFFSALFMYLLIFKYKEVLDFEANHIWSRYDAMCDKLKRFIRNQLRKSDRIVAWAETPAKHGRPDEEWITGQVKVWGDEWK
jgi:hypothetical protein